MAAPLKDKNEIKIFILYLLYKIGYPLGYNTITSIMIQDGVVEFFDFSECFMELVEGGMINVINPPEQLEIHDEDIGEEDNKPQPLYEISPSGKHIALELSDNLMHSVRERSYRSALRHLSFDKMGAKVSYDIEHNGSTPLFKCKIEDKNGVVLNVDIKVDNDKQLEKMRVNFQKRPEVIYRGVISLLTGDVNYIFED